MIDLRSDTVTVPTREMMSAIMNARVGDDVYGEDPDVNELQEYVADLFGKESALFVPSGTMSNQLCINVLTNTGDEIICEADAHIFYYETAAPSILSRVQVNTIESENGVMDINKIKEKIRPDVYYFPKTSVICLENTHNRHGGTIIPLDYIDNLGEFCKENGIKYHCDGARIWNACIATGISPKEFVKPFDTVSVCLSKGLGAPVGSLMLSSKENISKALKMRKIFGGGMRQVGILAAAGLHAVKNHFQLLEGDHNNAKLFAGNLAESEHIQIDLNTVETNIVSFKHREEIDSNDLVELCKQKGVIFHALGNNQIRIVFHFQISESNAIKAADILKDALNKLMK